MKVLQAADKLPGGKIGVTDAEGDAVVPGQGIPEGPTKRGGVCGDGKGPGRADKWRQRRAVLLLRVQEMPLTRDWGKVPVPAQTAAVASGPAHDAKVDAVAGQQRTDAGGVMRRVRFKAAGV